MWSCCLFHLCISCCCLACQQLSLVLVVEDLPVCIKFHTNQPMTRWPNWVWQLRRWQGVDRISRNLEYCPSRHHQKPLYTFHCFQTWNSINSLRRHPKSSTIMRCHCPSSYIIPKDDTHVEAAVGVPHCSLSLSPYFLPIPNQRLGNTFSLSLFRDSLQVPVRISNQVKRKKIVRYINFVGLFFKINIIK